MSVATAIVESVQSYCNQMGLTPPKVKQLHLPPYPWNQNRDGEFGAIELQDGSLGLSYVLLGRTLEQLTQRTDGQLLAGLDALDVARWWLNESGTKQTIGFAALNAISRHLFDRCGFVPPPATDSIAGLSPVAGEHIGMIGYFPPLIKRVVDSGARLTVLELREALAGDHDAYRITLDPSELLGCDKVLSTSTILLNHSIDRLLPTLRTAGRIALIGPGAGCLPDALFACGIHTLGGTWIHNGPGFVKALTDGQPWGKRFAYKFTLNQDDYPGLSASTDDSRPVP